MKSMFILTDFSEAAFRAAEYACELTPSLNVKRVVLYHAYQPVIAYAGMADVAVADLDDQHIYLESMESLGMLQDRLKPLVARDVTIDMVAKDTGLAGIADGIREHGSNKETEMIVMGAPRKPGLGKFLLGSTTTAVLRNNEWPTLIVPEDMPLGKGISTIVLTSDLKQAESLPLLQLYEFLNGLPGKLEVVNVEPEAKESYSPEMEKAIAGLHQLLEKYEPRFHYIAGDDIVKEILHFAGEQQASLIIAVHQKRGFLPGLFHKSVTKKLAYDSAIPLLSLPGFKK